jgi:hypothetical protein
MHDLFFVAFAVALVLSVMLAAAGLVFLLEQLIKRYRRLEQKRKSKRDE